LIHWHVRGQGQGVFSQITTALEPLVEARRIRIWVLLESAVDMFDVGCHPEGPYVLRFGANCRQFIDVTTVPTPTLPIAPGHTFQCPERTTDGY
jgi:hypothetical protein